MEFLVSDLSPSDDHSKAATTTHAACKIQALARGRLVRGKLLHCPICMQKTNEPVSVSSCQHEMCAACATRCALKGIRNCPLCRAPCQWKQWLNREAQNGRLQAAMDEHVAERNSDASSMSSSSGDGSERSSTSSSDEWHMIPRSPYREDDDWHDAWTLNPRPRRARYTVQDLHAPCVHGIPTRAPYLARSLCVTCLASADC